MNGRGVSLCREEERVGRGEGRRRRKGSRRREMGKGVERRRRKVEGKKNSHQQRKLLL